MFFGMFLPDMAPYRYWRLRVTAVCNEAGVDDPGGPVALYEMRLMVGSTANPTSPMSGASAPPPLVASASMEVDSGFAWLAFDNDTGTFWRGGAMADGPQYLQIDLGAAGLIRPTAVRIVPRETYFISAFQVIGSNSGAFSGEQRTLYSTSGVTSGWTAGVARTFTF